MKYILSFMFLYMITLTKAQEKEYNGELAYKITSVESNTFCGDNDPIQEIKNVDFYVILNEKKDSLAVDGKVFLVDFFKWHSSNSAEHSWVGMSGEIEFSAPDVLTYNPEFILKEMTDECSIEKRYRVKFGQ